MLEYFKLRGGFKALGHQKIQSGDQQQALIPTPQYVQTHPQCLIN